MPLNKPTRKTTEISQHYNDGVMYVYSVQDAAVPGYQPKPRLTDKAKLMFEEQRLGINRLYLSRQNQAEILRVLRVPRRPISTQDVVKTQDGCWYSIDAVQGVPGVYPPSIDVSLTSLKQEYEGLIENGLV